MELRLDGKVALVTGASRGIGRAVSAAFSAAGAHVMLSSRKEDALEEARRELAPSASGELEVFAANAGDASASRRRSSGSAGSTSSSTTPPPTPTWAA